MIQLEELYKSTEVKGYHYVTNVLSLKQGLKTRQVKFIVLLGLIEIKNSNI